MLRRSNVHCSVCGGRGHEYKKCASLKHIKAEAASTPVGRRILAAIIRKFSQRYKGAGNPAVIRRQGDERKTAGNFKGPLMRDVLRTMRPDELMVSGLADIFGGAGNG